MFVSSFREYELNQNNCSHTFFPFLSHTRDLNDNLSSNKTATFGLIAFIIIRVCSLIFQRCYMSNFPTSIYPHSHGLTRPQILSRSRIDGKIAVIWGLPHAGTAAMTKQWRQCAYILLKSGSVVFCLYHKKRLGKETVLLNGCPLLITM